MSDEFASPKKTLALSSAVLFVGAVITVFIFSTEPEARRGGATKQTAMLVEVTRVKRGKYRPLIVLTGSVEAARDVALSAQVGGRVIERGEGFVPGGFVTEGEVLLRIEPADYRAELAQRRSELRQVEAELQLEMGQQDLAKQNLELLQGELSERDRALVMREPQLTKSRLV